MYGHFAARRAPAAKRTGLAGLVSLLTFSSCLALTDSVVGQEAPDAVELRYARVVVDEAPLYCWPSQVASPPHYEDTLKKGDVVKVGRSEGGFYRVALPLGPVGYVSKRYSTDETDGKIRTKGSRVSFRYRMVTTEAPVMQLEEGTELFVLAAEGDWWRVRLPSAEAWLPKDQLQIPDQNDPELAKGWGLLQARFRQEIDARLEAIAAERKKRELEEADIAAVEVVQTAFQKELQKPVGEQRFAPLEETLDKVVATLSEDSKARALAASLRKRIQTQQWIVEAAAVTSSKPVLAETDLPPEQPKDSLDRFHAIGWLRYERRLGGMGTYYLEKGGLRLHHVTCKTGRYDLSMFVGCEIGIMGPRRQVADSFSEIDAERIEVLGRDRR